MACWQGYGQKGMKKKGKKMVPNCVPKGKNEELYVAGDLIELPIEDRDDPAAVAAARDAAIPSPVDMQEVWVDDIRQKQRWVGFMNDWFPCGGAMPAFDYSCDGNNFSVTTDERQVPFHFGNQKRSFESGGMYYDESDYFFKGLIRGYWQFQITFNRTGGKGTGPVSVTLNYDNNTVYRTNHMQFNDGSNVNNQQLVFTAVYTGTAGGVGAVIQKNASGGVVGFYAMIMTGIYLRPPDWGGTVTMDVDEPSPFDKELLYKSYDEDDEG